MAPRRSVRSVCISNNNNNNYNNLKLKDVLCPICGSILIEPVTLPCNHGFCASCFDGTVAHTNLNCPLCRARISTWLRKAAKKDNKPINSVLWEAIQKTFPEQVRNKQQGNEEYPEEDVPRRLTAPGEIRREYEVQKSKDLLEVQKQREVEAKASEEYIRKLTKQEEIEERARQENLRLSEQMAKKMAREFDPGPSSSKLNLVISGSKRQGPIDRLLKNMSQKKVSVTVQPVPEKAGVKEYTCKYLDLGKKNVNSKEENENATLINLMKMARESEGESNDSISSECRFFKPIERHNPLPRKVPIMKVPAIRATANTVIIGPPKEGKLKFNHASLGSGFAIYIFCELQPPLALETQTAIKTPAKRKSSASGSASDVPAVEPEPVEQSPSTSLSAKRTSKAKKTPDKSNHVTPSKRKCRQSSPEVAVLPKRARTLFTGSVGSPPFAGFDNTNLNELKARTNGALGMECIGIVSSNGDIKDNVNKVQEDEDFKLAMKLQGELNSMGRYSTRNSINSVYSNRNIRKPTAKQVTLKELISHTVSKLP